MFSKVMDTALLAVCAILTFATGSQLYWYFNADWIPVGDWMYLVVVLPVVFGGATTTTVVLWQKLAEQVGREHRSRLRLQYSWGMRPEVAWIIILLMAAVVLFGQTVWYYTPTSESDWYALVVGLPAMVPLVIWLALYLAMPEALMIPALVPVRQAVRMAPVVVQLPLPLAPATMELPRHRRSSRLPQYSVVGRIRTA